MPTILTHAALPLVAAWGLRLPRRLALAGALLAVAPDVDVIGRAFDVPHFDLLGHRGVSHSLLAALILALLAWPLIGRGRPFRSVLFLFAAAASHGLADMATHGSKGIMLWWPLSQARYEWRLQPIEASGILARSVTDGSLPGLLLAEFLWLVLPALLLVALYRLGRRSYIDLARGQS
ncbi:MAG TPA: metal-dependent hydrolase [Sphingomicrobium sp.]|nr:metal-dependent hydrolase [Sphingomicrobium sp.]